MYTKSSRNVEATELLMIVKHSLKEVNPFL